MAKSKRVKLGSILKSKDESKADYIKLGNLPGGSLTLKDGEYLYVETPKFQKQSISKAIEAGRMSKESGEKWLENLEKTPDFVRADVFLVVKTDN